MAIIQVRGVSDAAHRLLRERAAQRGQSLSGYLREEIESLAALPTLDEWVERVMSREPGGIDGATAVREAREEREREREEAQRGDG